MKITENTPTHPPVPMKKTERLPENDPYALDVRIDAVAKNATQRSSHTQSLCGSTCSQSSCSSRTCDGGSAC